ncbi:SgcJ/EcaC family oxidoreductase [Falsiroseomonas oryzae]|uniref:SgcJ/EcaC family oxidoreductase n=1 Tax=Falsiroseomonas oryzae TaxID=2766473 RepID=UPI0022EA2B33|nr:SgcJ/EcaC family oxidoreductase [Roseomonas sp. MO-31]
MLQRRRMFAALPSLALLPVAAEGAEMPRDPAAVLRAWAEAYATNDGERAAVLYTEDARVWGTSSREQTVGRAAIAAYFGRRRGDVAGISVSFGEHAVRQLSAEAAVASGHYTFAQRRHDGSTSQSPARFSMVMVRGQDGAWRIADHHSSRLPAATG